MTQEELKLFERNFNAKRCTAYDALNYLVEFLETGKLSRDVVADCGDEFSLLDDVYYYLKNVDNYILLLKSHGDDQVRESLNSSQQQVDEMLGIS